MVQNDVSESLMGGGTEDIEEDVKEDEEDVYRQ